MKLDRWQRIRLAPKRLDMHVYGVDVGAARHVYPAARTAARVASHLAGRTAEPAVCPDPAVAPELLGRISPRADSYGVVRSSRPNRWLVAACEGGRLRAFAKVGTVGDVGLAHEASMLERLRDMASGVEIPTVLSHEQRDGYQLLVTAPLPHRRRLSVPDAAALAVALADGSLFGIGVRHGDLAPWNVSAGPHGVTLLDWEHAVWESEPIDDLTHFVLSHTALVRRVGVGAAVAALERAWSLLDASEMACLAALQRAASNDEFAAVSALADAILRCGVPISAARKRRKR